MKTHQYLSILAEAVTDKTTEDHNFNWLNIGLLPLTFKFKTTLNLDTKFNTLNLEKRWT